MAKDVCQYLELLYSLNQAMHPSLPILFGLTIMGGKEKIVPDGVLILWDKINQKGMLFTLDVIFGFIPFFSTW